MTMTKLEALGVLLPRLAEHQVVICNGMIGREVYSIVDRPNHFYMIGSMGIATSIAFGLAHCQPQQKVAVFEGDGNTLMGLNNLAQVGAFAPRNLLHICLDNGTHASTGDQKTISKRVPLEAIADAAGYSQVWRCTQQSELEKALQEVEREEGPHFILVEVAPGTVPGVPRVEIEPPALTERFANHVRSTAQSAPTSHS